jgi:hypothetical protein
MRSTFLSNACVVEWPVLKPYWSFLIAFSFISWKYSLFKIIFSKSLPKEFRRLTGL